MHPDLLQTTARYVSSLHRLGVEAVAVEASVARALRAGKPKEPSRAPVQAAGDVVRTSAPVPASVPPVSSLAVEPIPTFVPTGDKKADLLALHALVAPCVRCAHLAKTRRTVVFGVGNPQARILFVGEAPGAEEDEAGEPFVGRAGQLLTKMIQAMGLQREDVYIANVLKCRPDMPPGSTGNRKPTPQEMATCLPYLKTQIGIIRPEVMVALGATAVEGLLGPVKIPMSRLRGTWQEFEGIPFMPTYHPAYLLRNQSITEKRKVWEDLLLVMERIRLPISEKQRGYFLSSIKGGG